MTQSSLHLLLLEAFLRSNRELTKRLPEADLLPGQPKILEFLLAHADCNQKDISEGCILDKSTVTSLLKRMEAAALISKEANVNDQRSSLISLTELGKQKALWVQQTLCEIDEAELADITSEERRQFKQTLAKIIQNQKNW